MRQDLKFANNTLAANDATPWMALPDGRTRFSIGIGWTEDGAPIGALAVQISNVGAEGVAGPVLFSFPSQDNPAGVAASKLLQNLSTTACFVRVVFAHTSGGVGSSFTDDNGTPGSSPNIAWEA